MRPCVSVSGNALHAMRAGFEFQFRKRAAALHLGDDFLVTAHGAFAGRDHLDLPALQGRKPLIHPEQVAGEQRGLVAAGAGADFQHHVAVVHGVFRQQRDADLLLEIGDARPQRLEFGLRHAAHFRIGCRIREQRFGIRDLGAGRAVGFDGVDQRIEVGEFARDLDVFLGTELPKQLGLERSVMGEQDIEFGFG